MNAAHRRRRLAVLVATSLLGWATAHAQTPDEQFHARFATGVEAQQRAEGTRQNSGQRSVSFARAEQAYSEALRLRPDSVATLNNLGALNASLGHDVAARNYYRQAVAAAQKSGDPKLEGYALNYAEYLEPLGDPEALSVARIAFSAPNSGPESRELLARLYAKQARESLLPFCVTLLERGFTEQVRGIAVANANDIARAVDIRGDWLILLVVTLAHDALGAAAFDPTATVSGLKPAAEDSMRGAITELQAAVRQPPGDGRALAWWFRASEPRNSIGVSGRAAMLGLLRSLGERDARIASPRSSLASQYLRTAIDLGEHGPDPEAFLALVNIIADARDERSLADLMRRYEFELFSEKGEAYRRNDWPLIYRLHIALGLTYAHQGVWENTGSPFQNAKFQLEAAQRAAVQLNARARAAGQPETAALPPVAVSHLTAYYDRSGRKDLSTQLRIETAQMLLKADRINDSKKVLKDVEVSEVAKMTPKFQAQFQNLQSITRPR